MERPYPSQVAGEGAVPLEFSTEIISRELRSYMPNIVNSDDSLACRFTAKHGNVLRYVSKWHQWMHWKGWKWAEEDTLLAFDLAREVAREAVETTPGISEPQKKELTSAAKVAAIVKLACSDRIHAASALQWDTQKLKLNTPDGVIDLCSGEISNHDPGDYMSKATSVGPSLKPPKLWLSFLERILPDPEIRSFVQRMAGYCLSGDTKAEAIFFLYGGGGNGKSTLTGALTGILNDYAKESPAETWMESKTLQHSTDLAALQGARLALVREVSGGQWWNEAKLKHASGGDRISARKMRCDPIEFTPQFKLVISGNKRPRFRAIDDAVRRRLHLIPFEQRITGVEVDVNLKEKLRAEWPSILHWCIEGAVECNRAGLLAPDTILSATSDYLEAEDKAGCWLEDRCVVGKNEQVGSTAAYQNYRDWCEKGGEQPEAHRSFTKELISREGISCTKKHGVSTFVGFSLLQDQPTPSDDSWSQPSNRW